MLKETAAFTAKTYALEEEDFFVDIVKNEAYGKCKPSYLAYLWKSGYGDKRMFRGMFCDLMTEEEFLNEIVIPAIPGAIENYKKVWGI